MEKGKKMVFGVTVKGVTGLLTTYLHASSAYFSSLNTQAQPDPSSFDWDAITPSAKLVYHDCYERLQCARMEVPLDWSNLSNPNKVAIAIARLPAPVDADDPTFGGTIVLNPGGPGGSGITLVHDVGPWLQEIVNGEKHYELLSFDPRGVHYTTPTSACFGDSLSRQVFKVKNSALDSLDSAEGLNSKWAAMDGFGSLCAAEEATSSGDGSNIRSYVSTRLVAQDMIAIVDRVDEHRRGSSLPIKRNTSSEEVATDGTNQHVINGAGQAVPLINYWGFSYGTLLGNTLVSLFPGRIGRAILDGVVDAVDYSASPGWLSNLQNTDEALQSLYRYCFEGGSACPLFAKTGAGPASIESRVNRFLEDLAENPMPTVHNGTTELVTYADVRRVIFRSTYGPTHYYPALAQLLSDLMSGNATLMIPHLQHVELPETKEKPIKEATKMKPNIRDKAVPFPDDLYDHSDEAAAAILCGDSDPLTSFTKPQFTRYVAELRSESKMFGSLWAEIKLACTRWPASLRPSDANRFTGPFESSAGDYDSRGAPVLFIGNMLDNVTPLRNAHKMSEGHEGSVVLTQDSAGHCSVFSAPSECTRKVIRRYFDTGELPQKGTICKADRVPWDGKSDEANAPPDSLA
jgi:pimeloyl-ACP methyl ester carboxylesterase